MTDLPPIKVDVLYDDATLKAGTAESETSIDGLADAIDQSTQQVKASLDSVGTALKDMSATADTESDAVGASLRSMDDTAGTAMTGLSSEVEQGESKLKEMGATASEEIPGAMTDMSDSVSDAATGLSTAFASLGPAGIGVGAVLAGIGIIMRKSQEAKAKIQADAAEWASAYVEGLGVIGAAARRASIDSALADPESDISKIRDTMLEITGAGLGQIIKAMYGTPSEQAAAQGNLIDQRDTLKDMLTDSYTNGKLTDEQRVKLVTQLETYNKLLDTLDATNTSLEIGRKNSDAQLEAEIQMGLLTKDELQKMETRNERQKDYLETTLSIETAMANIALSAGDIGDGLAAAWRITQGGDRN